MTAEELMKPRFEVISDYPFNPYKIGDIIKSNYEWFHQTTTHHRNEFGDNIASENYEPASSFEKYPHIFRKLNWWEHRNINDMPKKLKSTGFDNICVIEEWDMVNMIGWVDKKNNLYCPLLLFKTKYNYFPVD